MLKRFVINVRGQSVAAQYMIMFFVVIGALTAMSVYFRRAFQGRVYDAQKHAIIQAQAALGQSVAMEYEPYYTDIISNVDQRTEDRTHLVQGGVFNKVVDMERSVNARTIQLPPKGAR